jgi:hypothetical protein
VFEEAGRLGCYMQSPSLHRKWFKHKIWRLHKLGHVMALGTRHVRRFVRAGAWTSLLLASSKNTIFNLYQPGTVHTRDAPPEPGSQYQIHPDLTAMFNFTPLLGAQSTSAASQSLLEFDGGVKILIDVGWDESFDVAKLKEIER